MKLLPSHSVSEQLPPWIDPSNKPKTLHDEILMFVEYISATSAENRIRKEAVQRLQNCVAKLWPDAKVEVFGSTVSGLSLPVGKRSKRNNKRNVNLMHFFFRLKLSDIDVAVLNAPPVSSGALHELAKQIQKAKIAVKLKVIAKAILIICLFLLSPPPPPSCSISLYSCPTFPISTQVPFPSFPISFSSLIYLLTLPLHLPFKKIHRFQSLKW
jgi:hypothetical protein